MFACNERHFDLSVGQYFDVRVLWRTVVPKLQPSASFASKPGRTCIQGQTGSVPGVLHGRRVDLGRRQKLQNREEPAVSQEASVSRVRSHKSENRVPQGCQ